MHRNKKILHREVKGKGGQADYFIIIEYSRDIDMDIPSISYIYKIPQPYIEELAVDYNDVEIYAPLCPN